MDHPWILPVPEYYHRLNAYVLEAGLPRLKEAWNWRVILPRKKAHQ